MSGEITICTGIQEMSDALRTRLQRYIEAAYYLRDTSVVAERRALLTETGAIAREPFVETTPSYEAGPAYAELALPSSVGTLLDQFATWQPGIGVFPKPYRHQAEALKAFFNERRDLIVSTGTGSGKTETFLLPILGSLIDEAETRRDSFRLPGLRALLLYPMNALVSDQIARLRRLFGDERLSTLFRDQYGRHPRFGMYTSRTPYPGSRDPKKDHEYVEPLLRYYLDLEEAAIRNGSGSDQARLVEELRMRGRWPAKDLSGFFGTPGSQWSRRLITQPGDRELLTRHEMQEKCPDILVTNYSMLEYMLMRPIERSIFAQTRTWLESHPDNALILVVDEAHLYRGTSGAEVAYLIRRLQARLELPRERLRCILTSASLGPDATIEADAVAFAEALTGSPRAGGRSFYLVRGYRELRPPACSGSMVEAEALAAFDQDGFAWRATRPSQAIAAVEQLGTALGWPRLPDTSNGDDQENILRRYLYDRLYGFGPVEMLIAASAGRAISLTQLATKVFPEAAPLVARRATEALLALGVYAHNGQRPLLQTRLHLLFRGLPSLWACINLHCSARLSTGNEPALLGRLYTEPRTHCSCGARVYEVLVHRSCGAVFLRVFGVGEQPIFYWHEAGGRVKPDTPLREEWLIVEHPLRKYEIKGLVEPIWMDIQTGRVTGDPPVDPEGYRQFWRSTAKARANSDDTSQSVESQTFPFARCPICDQKTPEKVADLATRGERPFANIIHEQFVQQPPGKPFSEHYPNGGRKVLIFSDGRQKAARLARDLPREVEFDVFRQALALAVHRLQIRRRDPVIGNALYAAFVAISSELHLHFFDREFDSQAQLLRHMHEFRKQYNSDLDLVLSEEDSQFGDPPLLYHQLLFDQVANPFYNVYSLGVMVPKPSQSALRKMQRNLPPLPERVQKSIETISTFWIRELLEHGAFGKNLPPHIRQRVLVFDKVPARGKAFKEFESVLKDEGLSDEALKNLRTLLYDVLTELDEHGRAYLRPTTIALQLAVDDDWFCCASCGNLQHTPFLDRCCICGERTLDRCPPHDARIAARLDFYRQPIRDVLRGARPVHITAEEHTAQLSQRDAGAVYATTEEFELRFQDVALGQEKPPIDVLSCTTTMEVGIDIGSLVAIGMRNIPPQRENYQQRAGRAGRRSAALSTVVTFADNGSHDQFYYHHPEEMIAGDPRRPFLSIDRPMLARRHIHAYLLQTFFHEQIDRLDPAQRTQFVNERRNLFTALGTWNEFFSDSGSLSFQAFCQWFNTGMNSVVQKAAAWLPDQLVGASFEAKCSFVITTAQEFMMTLEQLNTSPESSTNAEREHRAGRQHLLDTLFDVGLLPGYAFPTDLTTFYIFGRDGDRIVLKEQLQRSKVLALSEYAPGRLLVVNKETYRVGGIYEPSPGLRSNDLVQKLSAHPLPRYVYCSQCTYVRIDPSLPTDGERCPVCRAPLQSAPLLDPPGFAPESGRPVGERDRDQDLSYADEARLPLPIESEQLVWHAGRWLHLQYAYAENQQLIVVNSGPNGKGFVVCEDCGAAWPTDSKPDGEHDRPYLTLHGRTRCRGSLHPEPIYLGTTFRSTVLLLRCSLIDPLDRDPLAPWLRDALRTTAESLALATSRVLDVDPVELSSGYRLLPGSIDQGTSQIDLYLFDTATNGAGYAAEAGSELEQIFQAALQLVDGCPNQCERSCTRCLRHYGNRFWHSALDRRLALQMLQYILYGIIPQIHSVDEQRHLLKPLKRFLELEGWKVEGDLPDIPLAVRTEGKIIGIGAYPALLNARSTSFNHPLQGSSILLQDYIVVRDLPTAYVELKRLLRV